MNKLILLLVAVFLLSGCESAFDTRPIAQKYDDQLSKIEIGMPLDDFRKLLPKAYVAGQTTVSGNRIDAYELSWHHTERMMGDRVTERLWFYFANKKLLKWGSPGDWPSPAEVKVKIEK